MSDEEFKTAYHIDYVVALANFEFSNEKNQFIAFNWQNTRFLLKSKTLRLGAKRDLWGEVMQELKVINFV